MGIGIALLTMHLIWVFPVRGSSIAIARETEFALVILTVQLADPLQIRG